MGKRTEFCKVIHVVDKHELHELTTTRPLSKASGLFEFVIIQLMRSFEVGIRICQPENSEHHFRGLTNPDVNQKGMHQLFCYMTLSLFS